MNSLGELSSLAICRIDMKGIEMKRIVVIWGIFSVGVLLMMFIARHVHGIIRFGRDQFGESYSYIDKMGEMKSERVMPHESKNIKYVFRDTGFGYSLGFRCSLDEKSFVDFARGKGMAVTNSLPLGLTHDYFFFDVSPLMEQYYFAEDSPGRAEGLKVIYARRASVMIGQYSDR